MAAMVSESCRTEKISTGFSLVVDDVDAGQPSSADEEMERTTLERRSSSSSDKGEIDDRVRQMQVEAESRKNEFAKLLEEHAQVIRQLKQMEDEPPTGSSAQHHVEAVTSRQ